jgi:hypothetical protein
MSLLPQRKKSPEELAKLRESIGVPHSGSLLKEISQEQTPPPVDTIVPTNHEATVIHEDFPLELPKPSPKQVVHSFKRSERIAAEEEAPAPAAPPQSRGPKPIRSLRKSDRLPSAPHPESPPDSPLPHHRHSDREIAEIRRREALAVMNARPNSKLFPAHLGVIIPGYLSAAAGAAGFHFYQFPIIATLAFVAVSLVIAAFIGTRKPVSRHHAAFIAAISLLVLIFGALHYFPQLRHAA